MVGVVSSVYRHRGYQCPVCGERQMFYGDVIPAVIHCQNHTHPQTDCELRWDNMVTTRTVTTPWNRPGE